MMQDYFMRGVITLLAAGALGVLFARQVAHWTDWYTSTVRFLAYSALAVGIVGLAILGSVMAAVKLLAVALVVCPIMAWVDAVCERKEAELADEKAQKFFGDETPRHRRAPDRSALGPPPRTPAEAPAPEPLEVPPPPVDVPDSVARMYASKECPHCGRPFFPGTEFIECDQCRSWYHPACWQGVGGCVVGECPGAMANLSPAARKRGLRASHNLGVCPYCQTPVSASAESVRCPGCDSPYHKDCWQENSGCAVYGCSARTR